MKKSTIPLENKQINIAEVRYLEESQEHGSSQEIATENFELNWVSKDTCFALSPIQLEKIKEAAEKVFKLTNETWLEIVKHKNFEPWMNSHYGEFKPLWENSNTGLSLMRIDFAWDQAGNLKVLELNTSSQTGWIVCHLAEKAIQAEKNGLPLAPQPFFYSQYILEKLGPRVAIIFPPEYSKDLSSQELKLVVQQIESLGGKCQTFCLSETTLAEIINFAPTGLFWKCDSLSGYEELVLKLTKLNLPQLPSFESLFIAGDKSFLSTLKTKNESGLIPPTYILSKDNLDQNINFLAKDKSVLKPGDSGNGEGIEFGKNFTERSWREKIREAMNSRQSWIIQELCFLQNASSGRYEDISVFVSDGVVRGLVSRISTNEIVNVSNGGLFQPVILLENQKSSSFSKFTLCSLCSYLNSFWKK